MYRTPFLFALLFAAAASFACDADVLRLNYRKTPAVKLTPKPATALPKSNEAVHKAGALTASMKLEPR